MGSHDIANKEREPRAAPCDTMRPHETGGTDFSWGA